MDVILTLLNLMGGLGVFLFGMKIMSEGLHKTSGEKFHNLLNVMTGKPPLAIATGFLTTTVIQSSSATTVMLVSLVNAQLLTLGQAIGVVMGANIGTTMTAWIVSFLGFKVKITAFALPAIAIAIPFFLSKREKLREFAEILIGFGLLFLGLHFMKDAVSSVNQSPEFFQFLSGLTGLGPLSIIIFVIVGTLLTIAVQSSSAAMTLTLTFAFNGWIDFNIAAAIVLGENIGTTITAYLASLKMNTTARRAARAHMVFNLIGVGWMLLLFVPVLELIDIIVPGLRDDPEATRFHLSAFHTFFNITNTLLLVWFIPQLEKLVIKLVKDRDEVKEGIYSITYIQPNIPDSAEINLINARAEIGAMSRNVAEMVNLLINAIGTEKKDLSKLKSSLQKKEDWIDQMQEQLIDFLSEVSTNNLTENQANEVSAQIRIVNELESTGDSCIKIISFLLRKEKKNLEFHRNAVAEIKDFASKVSGFMQSNASILSSASKSSNLEKALDLENAINKERKTLDKISRNEIIKGGDVKAELLFMDIVRQYEHIGDFCTNIAEAIRRYTDSDFEPIPASKA